MILSAHLPQLCLLPDWETAAGKQKGDKDKRTHLLAGSVLRSSRIQLEDGSCDPSSRGHRNARRPEMAPRGPTCMHASQHSDLTHAHTHTWRTQQEWHTLSFVETSPAVTALTDSYDGLAAMQRVWLAQVQISSWEVNQIQFRQEICKLLHVLRCQMFSLRCTVSHAAIWFRL